MKLIFAILKSWLPLALAISLVCGLIYVVQQQSYRTNADDPQIQMAEDLARALAAGQAAGDLVPAQRVDISLSLAPYVIVFDTNGNPVASNAVWRGRTPDVPAGVLEYARAHGEDRVTYQPEPGERSAIVVVTGGKGGIVLVGRSLREVEARISRLGQMLLLGWMASLAATLVLVVLLEALPFARSRV